MVAKVTLGCGYCGCPSETVEVEYYEEDESDLAQQIMEAIWNREFPHYFIDVETQDDGEDEDDCR